MKKILLIVGALIILLGGTVLFTQTSAVTAMDARTKNTSGAETWNLGTTMEGSWQYADSAGRLVTNVASFRANQDVTDVYFVFPAAAEAKTVTAASVNLLSLSGTTPASALLTLEIYGVDGTLLQTITSDLDAKAMTPGVWNDFAIVDLNNSITAGNVLAAHLSFSGTSDLEIRCAFDIEVE